MNEQKDLSLLLRSAGKNRWLALNEAETEIVAESKNIDEVIEQAHRAGVNDPILIWSPKEWTELVA